MMNTRIVSRQPCYVWFCFIAIACITAFAAMMVPVAAIACTEVDGDIVEDTIWTADNSPYCLGNVTVAREDGPVTLTIEARVEIRGRAWEGSGCGSSHLVIGKNGALKVLGTESRPVIFTSENSDKEPGQWGKVIIQADARTSATLIEHAVFEYGANFYESSGYCGNRDYQMLDILGGSPVVQNSIFRHSNGNGLYIEDNASPVITGCKFENNEKYGIEMSNHASGTITGCDFRNNAENAILLCGTDHKITGNTFGDDQKIDLPDDISLDATLSVAGVLDSGGPVPYHLGGGVLVENAATPVTLTIQPGVEIQGNSWSGLNCGASELIIGQNAALRVLGTADAPVLFTSSGEDKAEESWGKIIIEADSRTSETLLDYAIVEYGSSGTYDATGYCHNRKYEMLDIKGGSPTIQNSTFRFSREHGLYIGEGASPEIWNCQFIGNADYGIEMHENAHGKIVSCDFRENDRAIRLTGTDHTITKNTFGNNQKIDLISDLTKDLTLQYPGRLDNGHTAPYFMDSRIEVYNETTPITLTIRAGVEIQGTNWGGYSCGSSQLVIGKNAALKVSGTSRKPVVFTSQAADNKAEDPWGRIIIEADAITSDTVIQYAVLEYGAADTYDVAGVCNNKNGEMLEIKGGAPKILYSTFQHSDEDGLNIAENAKPVISHCQFLYNEDDGIHLKNPAGGLKFEACEFIGNSDYGVQNDTPESCVDATGSYWGNESGPLDESEDPDCATLHNPNGAGDKVTDGVIYSNWSQVGGISIPDEPDDADLDGVIDLWDECPNTPMDTAVYETGCPASDLYEDVSDKDQIIADLNALIDGMYTEQQYKEALQICDVDGNGKTGLEEAIRALKIVAGVK